MLLQVSTFIDWSGIRPISSLLNSSSHSIIALWSPRRCIRIFGTYVYILRVGKNSRLLLMFAVARSLQLPVFSQKHGTCAHTTLLIVSLGFVLLHYNKLVDLISKFMPGRSPAGLVIDILIFDHPKVSDGSIVHCNLKLLGLAQYTETQALKRRRIDTNYQYRLL